MRVFFENVIATWDGTGIEGSTDSTPQVRASSTEGTGPRSMATNFPHIFPSMATLSQKHSTSFHGFESLFSSGSNASPMNLLADLGGEEGIQDIVDSLKAGVDTMVESKQVGNLSSSSSNTAGTSPSTNVSRNHASSLLETGKHSHATGDEPTTMTEDSDATTGSLSGEKPNALHEFLNRNPFSHLFDSNVLKISQKRFDLDSPLPEFRDDPAFSAILGKANAKGMDDFMETIMRNQEAMYMREKFPNSVGTPGSDDKLQESRRLHEAQMEMTNYLAARYKTAIAQLGKQLGWKERIAARDALQRIPLDNNHEMQLSARAALRIAGFSDKELDEIDIPFPNFNAQRERDAADSTKSAQRRRLKINETEEHRAIALSSQKLTPPNAKKRIQKTSSVETSTHPVKQHDLVSDRAHDFMYRLREAYRNGDAEDLLSIPYGDITITGVKNRLTGTHPIEHKSAFKSSGEGVGEAVQASMNGGALDAPKEHTGAVDDHGNEETGDQVAIDNADDTNADQDDANAGDDYNRRATLEKLKKYATPDHDEVSNITKHDSDTGPVVDDLLDNYLHGKYTDSQAELMKYIDNDFEKLSTHDAVHNPILTPEQQWHLYPPNVRKFLIKHKVDSIEEVETQWGIANGERGHVIADMDKFMKSPLVKYAKGKLEDHELIPKIEDQGSQPRKVEEQDPQARLINGFWTLHAQAARNVLDWKNEGGWLRKVDFNSPDVMEKVFRHMSEGDQRAYFEAIAERQRLRHEKIAYPMDGGFQEKEITRQENLMKRSLKHGAKRYYVKHQDSLNEKAAADSAIRAKGSDPKGAADASTTNAVSDSSNPTETEKKLFNDPDIAKQLEAIQKDAAAKKRHKEMTMHLDFGDHTDKKIQINGQWVDFNRELREATKKPYGILDFFTRVLQKRAGYSVHKKDIEGSAFYKKMVELDMTPEKQAEIRRKKGIHIVGTTKRRTIHPMYDKTASMLVNRKSRHEMRHFKKNATQFTEFFDASEKADANHQPHNQGKHTSFIFSSIDVGADQGGIPILGSDAIPDPNYLGILSRHDDGHHNTRVQSQRHITSFTNILSMAEGAVGQKAFDEAVTETKKPLEVSHDASATVNSTAKLGDTDVAGVPTPKGTDVSAATTSVLKGEVDSGENPDAERVPDKEPTPLEQKLGATDDILKSRGDNSDSPNNPIRTAAAEAEMSDAQFQSLQADKLKRGVRGAAVKARMEGKRDRFEPESWGSKVKGKIAKKVTDAYGEELPRAGTPYISGSEMFAAWCPDRITVLQRLIGAHPCRNAEEKSCNLVNAVCGQRLKRFFFGIADGAVGNTTRARVGRRCNRSIESPLDDQDKSKKEKKGLDEDDCNAVTIDVPYLFENPLANMEGSPVASIKNNPIMQAVAGTFFGTDWPIDAWPAETVWGHAVHGKTGSWGFDSGTPQIYSHLYRIPQYVESKFPQAIEEGVKEEAKNDANEPPMDKAVQETKDQLVGGRQYTGRDDVYLCDARDNPSHCALLGGGLNHCLRNYDDKACSYCEDMGDSLVCNVLGWSRTGSFWTRVPIYPRDVLGELYRGQWRNFYARPMIAKVKIPKAIMHNVTDLKVMPDYMITQTQVQMDWKTNMDRAITSFQGDGMMGTLPPISGRR